MPAWSAGGSDQGDLPAAAPGDPPEQVVTEIARTYLSGVPRDGQGFVDDPAATLAVLVTQMRALWDAVLAPWWLRISALLESEIASRARRLVAVGGQAAFTDLHPTVSWNRGDLVVHPTRKPPADVGAARAGGSSTPASPSATTSAPRTDLLAAGRAR
jgi:hypothetical protein